MVLFTNIEPSTEVEKSGEDQGTGDPEWLERAVMKMNV
jgi:hypothetical protein